MYSSAAHRIVQLLGGWDNALDRRKSQIGNLGVRCTLRRGDTQSLILEIPALVDGLLVLNDG